VVVAVAAAVASSVSPATAQHDAPAGDIYLEVVDGALGAELSAADAEARAGRLEQAVRRYGRLIETVSASDRHRLVPARPVDAVDRFDGVARPHVRYESLSRAIRRRLVGLGSAGRRLFTQRHESAARAALERARAAHDADALLDIAQRFPLAPSGAEAAAVLGDLQLERGRNACAVAAYALAWESGDPAIRERLAARRAWAARARGYSFASAPLAPPQLALVRGEPPGAADALTLRPVPVPGGVAVVRPGRVVMALESAGDRIVRTLPVGAEPLPEPAPGPLRLGGSSDGRVLAACVQHFRYLDGTGEAHLHDNPLRPAYDLFVFDMGREGALLGSTAEPTAFPDARWWLEEVEWSSEPVLAPGVVVAGAVSAGSEPELFVAAFRHPPLAFAWRTFLCARRFSRAAVDGPPLQTALVRSGGTIALDTGLGVSAGLDILTGEVRWLVWTPRPDPARTSAAPMDLGRVREPEPTWPPVALQAPAGAIAFSTSTDGAVRARRAGTGEVLWRVVAERVCRAVAAPDGVLVVADDGALFLVDQVTGKRLGHSLPLPAHAFVRGLGAASGGAALVPLGTSEPIGAMVPAGGATEPIDAFCLRLEVERTPAGPRLAAVGAQPLAGMGGFDVRGLPGGAAVVVGNTAHVWPAFGADWGRSGISGLLKLYEAGEGGEGLDGVRALRALGTLAAPRAPFEAGGYRVECETHPEGGFTASARPEKVRAAAWVELRRDREGRVSARVCAR
jgi:hypothetical protein